MWVGWWKIKKSDHYETLQINYIWSAFSLRFSKSRRVFSMTFMLTCDIVVNGRSNFLLRHPQSERSEFVEIMNLKMPIYDFDKANAANSIKLKF